MPESPEVEIFNRLVRDHCIGREIERVVVSDPKDYSRYSSGCL